MISSEEITSVVANIVQKYWHNYPPHVVNNYINRHAFEVQMLCKTLGEVKDKCVVDIGGGWGAFAAACSALGMKAMIVDDFGDKGKSNLDDIRYSLPKDFDVKVIRKDIVQGLDFPLASIDAVTSFDMVEHLHASPKRFFHDAMKSLRKDGIFFLGVPNCVNLRKRITVPLGIGSWSSFSDWYDVPVFRGHVREMDVRDLKKVAKDIFLCDYKIFGRNWLGYEHASSVIRSAVGFSDKIMRVFPSICSDLYLLGRKNS